MPRNTQKHGERLELCENKHPNNVKLCEKTGCFIWENVKIVTIYSWNCVKCTIFALTINYLGYGKATQKKS